MPSEVVKIHRCRGGVVRRFTGAEWVQLHLVGVQGKRKGVLERALELRLCDGCGSCLAVALDGDDWERNLDLLGDDEPAAYSTQDQQAAAAA